MMRKYFYLTLFLAVCLFQSTTVFSQYYYSPGDSAENSKIVTYDGDELDVYIYFHNNSTGPVKLIWRLLEESIPAEWSLGICDNVACYYNVNNSLYNAKTSDTISAGDFAFLKGVFDAHCTDGEGWIRVSSKVEDGSFNNPDTLFYKASTIAQCPSGIAEKGIYSTIQAYPNPITDEVFITSGFIAAQPLNINLTDLQGRLVGTFPSFQMNARIDMSPFPPGGYLLQFLEADNRLVAVRRVFKL